MLGSRTLFHQLFNEEEIAAPVRERKGRSEVLKNKQNELIVCRYFYYAKIHRKQYEDALVKLEEEVFLSQRTIINIINGNVLLLRNLNSVKPNLSYFKKKYPFYLWVLPEN